MQRDFPDAFQFALELKSCRRHEPYTVKICRLIPSATPEPPLNDAGREGVAELQCWGGGEVPVPASDRERPGDIRGMKATTEPLSATGRRAPSVAGDLTYWVWGPSGGAFDYPFSDWRGPTGGWGNP